MALALGLVGCGVMGRRHVLGMQRLRAIGQLAFDLAAVCDILPANAERLAGDAAEWLGRRPRVFTEVDAMLRDMRLEAIIITTTPETHTEVALKAFAAGVDVLAEKPVTLTVADGVRLVDRKSVV